MAPQSRFPSILITRPEPQASRFAQEVVKTFGAEVTCVLSPLMAPRYLRPAMPQGGFGSVVYTSETGVRAAAALGVDLPRTAFCVGDRTAKIATAMGHSALSAKGDADDLFQLLTDHDDKQPFLLLQGKETRGNLKARLQERGFHAERAVVYDQKTLPLTNQAIALLTHPGQVIAPIFSPKTAETLIAAMGHITLKADIRFVVISAACAEKLGLYINSAHISRTPDQSALMDVLRSILLRT